MNKEPQNYEELEIDLREYIKLLWRAKWFILVVFAAAVLAAFLVSNFVIEEEYRADITLRLSNADHEYASADFAEENFINTGAVEATSDALEAEGFSADRNFVDELVVETSTIERGVRVPQEDEFYPGILRREVGLLDVSITGNNPEELPVILKSMSDDYIENSLEEFERIRDRQLTRLERHEERMEEFEARAAAIEEDIKEIRAADDLTPAEETLILGNLNERLFDYLDRAEEIRDDYNYLQEEIEDMRKIEIVDSAQAPEQPIAPNTTLNMAIAGVLALMLAVFIVFFREFMKEEEL